MRLEQLQQQYSKRPLTINEIVRLIKCTMPDIQSFSSKIIRTNVLTCRRRIAEDVRTKMSSYERAHIVEPSVCALYLHFFLSLFAFAECCLFLALIFSFLVILLLLYYVIICVSCGKWKVSTNDLLARISKVYAIYSGFFCVIIGNIGA